MRVTLIGIDCATVDAKVGLSLGWYNGGRPGVETAVLCPRKTSAVATVAGWLRRAEAPALLAIDAPLGWPAPLAVALAKHRAGETIDVEPHAMFRRTTNRFIRDEVGKTPLDVGPDRIARTAHRALKILGELRLELGHPIPLAWDPSMPDTLAAIEVYPAATLHAHGFRSSAYKSAGQVPERREMITSLRSVLELPTDNLAMEESADALDAAVCILAGADFLAGRAPGPKDRSLAQQEGWIWASRVRIP